MKFSYPKSIIFIVLFLSLSSILHSQVTQNKLFDEYLNQYLKNKNVPSISAGLLENGEISWLNSIGKADLENNVPITKTSLYRIASISKSITAVAIMQLWERGLINLDTDARLYLPSFPEKKYKFTIRQLLNHTAGIRNYKEGEFDSKKYYASIDEALKVFAYDSLNFEPGTKYEYTSLDYSILAAIIEKVSKTSYEEFIKRNVFVPIRMNATRVDKQIDIVSNRVRGYEKNAERKLINAPLADLSIKIAGGGFLSTTDDLLLFAKALLENKLVKQSTLNLMTQRTILKNETQIDYGLGFSLEYKDNLLKYFSHTGAGTGFSSLLIIDPQLKIASVNLINIRDRSLGAPAKDILEMTTTKTLIKPTKTLSDDLMKNYLAFGIDSTNQRLNYIYLNEQSAFTLTENEAILFSADLLSLSKSADAIIYLKELLKLYPKSFKITVAIADAYLKDKNEGFALRYYRTAVQLNPNDIRVNNLIKKLSK